jgi:NADH dehydrogenase FAD-containing subunit
LIDVQAFAYYCGMIPGYLAKLYPNYEETRIDLHELCSKSQNKNNIEFVHDGVLDINFDKKLVYLTESTATIEFDMLSFDIGSATKSLDDVPGAFEYAIPTRPIPYLVERLLELAEQELHAKKVERPMRMVVVGGGASGIELAMSVVGRWRPFLGKEHLQVMLITSDPTILPEIPGARRALKELLIEKDLTLCFNATVVKVDEDFVHLATGMKVPYTYCLWATGAGCHDLARTLQQRGLDVTPDGWIRVQDTLQSTSHPNIFAAGDCCYAFALALPKAGVYALQEGPILARNLERFAQHQPLENFNPNTNGCLQFLSCGDGTALGFAFGLPLRGRWIWQIKNAMDHEFLSLFNPDGRNTYATESNLPSSNKRMLPPSQAAKLLNQIDIANYREAWEILKHMATHEVYRLQILKEDDRNRDCTSDEDDEDGKGHYVSLPAAQAAHAAQAAT